MRISIGEAAKLTGLSKWTLRALASKGIVDAVQIMNRWHFDRKDVLAVARTGTVDRVAKAETKKRDARVSFRRAAKTARAGT